MHDRFLRVVFGPSGAGKSTICDALKHPANIYYGGVNPHRKSFSVDDTRMEYYGKRIGHQEGKTYEERLRLLYDVCTPYENAYAYTLMFQDIERALILDGAHSVLMEGNLRTPDTYLSLTATVVRVQDALREIERQSAARRGEPAPAHPVSVHLRAVFVFCDCRTILERRRRRPYPDQEENFRAFARQVLAFQFPDFPFLALDTSDESPEAGQKRLEEVVGFFANPEPDVRLLIAREDAARACMAAMQEELRGMAGR